MSARKDFLKISHSERTQAQWDEQNKSSPQYVLERLEKFKKENDHIYEFGRHSEDEFWLYLHHFEVSEEDKQHANKVGDAYFRRKMRQAGISLSGNYHKKPKPEDYNIENVSLAVKRARLLHTNPAERWPKELGSHVYKLVSKFLELQSCSDKG